MWTAAALLVLVGIEAVVVPLHPRAVEEQWADAMRDMQSPFFDHLALLFNALGRGVGVIAIVGCVAVLLFVRHRLFALTCVLLVEGFAQIASSLLKALVGRPRPPDGLVHPVGSSFPSGHTTFAAATCVAIVLVFTSANSRRGPAWTLAATGVGLMAWSRTYLQVHWLLDVIAGAMLGTGIALGVFASAQLLVGDDALRRASRARRRGA